MLAAGKLCRELRRARRLHWWGKESSPRLLRRLDRGSMLGHRCGLSPRFRGGLGGWEPRVLGIQVLPDHRIWHLGRRRGIRCLYHLLSGYSRQGRGMFHRSASQRCLCRKAEVGYPGVQRVDGGPLNRHDSGWWERQKGGS